MFKHYFSTVVTARVIYFELIFAVAISRVYVHYIQLNYCDKSKSTMTIDIVY